MKYEKTDTTDKYQLTESDKQAIGNSLPDFTLSWFNTFHFGRFDIGMLWYAVIGNQKFNSPRATTYITGTNHDVQSIVSDSLRYMENSYLYESSFFVEDAGYIRLKTLTLTYNFPKKIAKTGKLAISLSVENLFTFTRYGGYDPEATIYTDNNFTDNAIDLGAWPNSRSYYIKFNLQF